MKFIILYIFSFIMLFANINNYKKELENKYLYLDNSGIYSITFYKHFIKLKFNDKKIFCENNLTISDNCNFMLSKKEIFNKSKIYKFLHEIYNLQGVMLKNKKSNTFLIIDDKYYIKNRKKIKKVLSYFNIIIIPLYNKKIDNSIINIKNKNKLIKIYKKYNFKLPTTITIR